MKVLFLCDFGSAHGGAEISTLTLRDGLRKRGHEAVLLSSSAQPSPLPILADHVCFGTTSNLQSYVQTANPSAWRTLKRVLRDFQPDVVHVSMFLLELSPLILPPLRDVPSLYHIHWLRPICPTGAKLLPDRSICQRPAGIVCYQSGCLCLRDWALSTVQMHLQRRWRSAFRRFVTPSEFVRGALMREGFPDVTIIPNGAAVRAPRPALSDPPTAFFCGRLVKEKGIDVLLKAWPLVLERAPSARLIIAGDGPDRPLLERRAPESVKFLGNLPHSAIDAVAAPAWVQVVPSVCIENFPLVVLESMMRGTGVVASSVGGLPEVVRRENGGMLVAPDNAQELAHALSQLLADRALSEEMGQRAREAAVHRWSEDAYLDRFIDLYESMRLDFSLKQKGRRSEIRSSANFC